MIRYFISISYKGSHYRGWQRQPNVITVQDQLEKWLKIISKKDIALWGCGRTDAGVHARQFFAHFDSDDLWDSQVVFLLNKSLPDDIVVHDIFKVPPQAHAQFDVINRTYTYSLHFQPDPFLFDQSTLYEGPQLMATPILEVLDLLPGKKDFHVFCKRPLKYNHTICDLSVASLQADKNKWLFTFTADRFLQGMVRLLIARLIEVGSRQISPQDFMNHLTQRKPFQFQWSAFPQGLFLEKITYPDHINVAGL